MEQWQRDVLQGARGELGTSITQMVPSDDQIICDHVKSVYAKIGVVLESAPEKGSGNKPYDSKCLGLAAAFLSDTPAIDNAPNRDILAICIQEAIEDWLRRWAPPTSNLHMWNRIGITR